jgi:thiamine biosynthesis protein ThiC
MSIEEAHKMRLETILESVEEAKRDGLDHVTLKLAVPDDKLLEDLAMRKLGVQAVGDGEYIIVWDAEWNEG